MPGSLGSSVHLGFRGRSLRGRFRTSGCSRLLVVMVIGATQLYSVLRWWIWKSPNSEFKHENLDKFGDCIYRESNTCMGNGVTLQSHSARVTINVKKGEVMYQLAP